MAATRFQLGGRNQDATVYIGNLDEKVTEALLTELMIQVGPVVHTHIPRDRITQLHQGYGFVEFPGEADAEYAVKVMNGIKLFGKPLRINKSSGDRRATDVGASLFIGNLAPEVDKRCSLILLSCLERYYKRPKWPEKRLRELVKDMRSYPMTALRLAMRPLKL